jgi:hypothetical protein
MRAMITVGSVSREEAAKKFYFLQEQIHGLRKAVNELTHRDPDFVFWIYPDRRLFDAKDATKWRPGYAGGGRVVIRSVSAKQRRRRRTQSPAPHPQPPTLLAPTPSRSHHSQHESHLRSSEQR